MPEGMQGMLGRLPLSALRGPRDALENLLAGSDGEAVLGELKKFVKRQPCWVPKKVAETQKSAEEPKLRPTIVELGVHEFDYDMSIVNKLAAISDPKQIAWRTEWATDEKFPDDRTGKKRFKVSAVHFGQWMAHDAVEAWCAENKKILARGKEGIDLAAILPRPQMDNVMSLALAGQFFVGAYGNRRALYFSRLGDERGLRDCWLGPVGLWRDFWWFLVLEELP